MSISSRFLNVGKLPAVSAIALVLAGATAPAAAQDRQADARLNRIEAEVRALQRKVFPNSAGPAPAPAAAPTSSVGAPATTPMTDLLARMETVEGQIARLTAQIEENGNHIRRLEARLTAVEPEPPAIQGPVAPGASAAPSPMPATSAPAAAALGTAAPAVARPSVNTASVAQTSPTPRPAAPSATTSAAPATPLAQRLAAVRAIVKPQTQDPGDDEYSYGFRLWEARFYPEAQQQLKLMIDRYPRHARISFAQNLLGRAYLDDRKPREAAQWFLKNYQSDKRGARAPDSLLFLADSMRQVADTSRACIALAEFGENYPAEAVGRLKSQYDQARTAVKCN